MNYFEENGVDFNRFKDSIGPDIDIFDIVLMIGFDIEAKLKSERISFVKEDMLYTNLNDEQKEIINELFGIYERNDLLAIDGIDALQLPNFNQFGGFIPALKKMGGKQEYIRLLEELIEKIYEE
jgi:hypothetical protein